MADDDDGLIVLDEKPQGFVPAMAPWQRKGRKRSYHDLTAEGEENSGSGESVRATTSSSNPLTQI